MAKSWGSTKGSTSSDKLDYLKFPVGKTQFRIVSDVLPRYVYWITNNDGKPAAFDCLRFNRQSERFLSGAKDPVHDLGYKEKEENPKTKKIDPLKPKKNYVCWVIDRSDNKLKIMEVKATILKGIQSTMSQLDLNSPMDIDFTIEKTGKGFDTEYKVLEIAAMQFQTKVAVEGSKEANQYVKDLELLGERFEDEDGNASFSKVPDLDEQFPIPTYEEQKEAVQSFQLGKQEDESGDEGKADENQKEATNDLDD